MENSGILIRLRLMGEPWLEFSTPILVSENAMIIQGASDRRMIPNLRNIVEFELDRPHRDLSANSLYVITY